MNKLIATLTAASMLLVTQAPAFASDRGKEVRPVGKVTIHANSGQAKKGHSNNFGKVAFGVAIGAGLVGALIASRADAEPRYQSRTYVTYASDGMCRVWRTDCRHGDDRACYKYENRC